MKNQTEHNDPIHTIKNEVQDFDGLTKLEYFAGLAMQALITNAPEGNLGNSKEGAPLAVQWANSLIEALNNNPHSTQI